MMVIKIDEIIVISSTNAYYTYMQSLYISSWVFCKKTRKN